MNKRILFLLVFALFAISPLQAKKIKYVFYFIGDGMGINAVHGAEMYNRATGKGPENINFFHFPVRGFVTTSSASALVTDSAAAGTALATGSKANNYALGLNGAGEAVTSLALWAKEAGYGTAVATSVGINHATPAAFYAHQSDRNSYVKILKELIGSDIGFAAGASILIESDGEMDAQGLIELAESSGINVLKGKEEVLRAGEEKGRVICLGDSESSTLTYAIDREDDSELALGDFVNSGIDYLYNNYRKKGFFFMVEGGKIDYSAHGEDAVTTFHEINDFASSIDIALEFYKEHPQETLIIVTSDHETGGLILGTGSYKMYCERLAAQNVSETMVNDIYARKFSDRVPSWEELKDFLKEYYGLWGEISPENISDKSFVRAFEKFEKNLKEAHEKISAQGEEEVKNLYSANKRLIYDATIFLNNIAGFSWAHSGHSASPLGLYVIGPKAEEFSECRDNTDIPKTIAKVVGY